MPRPLNDINFKPGDRVSVADGTVEAWLAGFWAASLLFSGRYEDYAAARDKFLASTKEGNSNVRP